MIRSRSVLPVVALLALGAWANAQAMACCWLPDVVEAARPSTEPMATDHSCCPGSGEGESASSGSGSPMGCGMDESGMIAPCCERADAAAASSAISVPDLLPVLQGLAPYPSEAEAASGSPHVLVMSSLHTGPPVYLSVQRLLI